LDINGYFRRKILKFKLAYLYIVLALGVVITLFILSRQNENSPMQSTNISGEQMPDDEVHKGLQDPTKPNPSRSNVSPEVYQKMEALKKDVEANPDDTTKIKAYADFMTAAHKPEEALPYYEKILNINPERNDVLFKLAMIYYDKQELDKAEEYTNLILKNDKDNTQAMYNLGAIAASKGEKDRAKEIWNKLVTDYPNDEAARLAKSSLEKL
jgi:tetratricopeptide (TPR) repeat protein